MNIERLVYWITERRKILKLKNKGAPKPWTQNPVLQSVRFCNVDREDDKVTQWIAQWRKPQDADNWFAMAVARWINHPPTLEAIGYPIPWKPEKVLRILQGISARGEKVWTAAYVIATQGADKKKPQYVVEDVLNPLWAQRKELRPRKGDTLESFAGRLRLLKNQGSFMVGQVVADIKQTDPILREASDWWTFAYSGPGSRRGLNRVMGRETDKGWPEAQWKECLLGLLMVLKKELPMEIKKVLDAQNLQNCLCEFDKFQRVSNNEPKRARAKYPGV